MTDRHGYGCAHCPLSVLTRKHPNSMNAKLTKIWIDDYIQHQVKLTGSLPLKQIARWIDHLRKANEQGRQIFVCGNGANAANASHFAADLGKGASASMDRPFRVLSLNDNTSWLTAIGNDYDFADVFWRQLQNYAQPGDLLIAASVSGSSPNLVKAFEWANQRGLKTLAMIGSSNGKLGDLAKEIIVLEDTHYGRVEDLQMTIYHMLCFAFIELSQ